MTTIPELAERFGISEKSIRRRLDSLDPVVKQHVSVGRQNATLVADQGVVILDRLLQIEREDRLSPSVATEKVIDEIQNGSQVATEPTVQDCPTDGSAVSNGVTPQGVGESEFNKFLLSQVEDLRKERDRLLSLVESQGERLLALGPAPTEQGKVSRLAGLKLLLTGKL